MYSLVLATMITTGTATPSWGCHGCYGCGGCWSNAFSGCCGCYGGCYGCYGGCYGCYGGGYGGYYGGYGRYYGGNGYYGAYYGCSGCWGNQGQGGVGAKPPEKKKSDDKKPEEKRKSDTRPEDAPAPARVTFMLPDGARLFVNDVPVAVTPAVRTFATPALEPGRSYHYVFTAELQSEGRLVRDVQRVDVAAGREVIVEFKGLPSAAAARR